MSNYLRRRIRSERPRAAVPAPRWGAVALAFDVARQAAQERAGEVQPPAGADAPPATQRRAGAKR